MQKQKYFYLKDEITIIDDSSNTIEVLVKSKGFSLLPYVFSKPTPITLNVDKETFKRNKTISWDVINKTHIIKENLGSSFDIISVDPDTLIFTYDILASKKVPIKFNENIKYALGFDVINQLKLSQDSVKLVGPQNILNDIFEIETEALELNDVKANIKETLNLKIPKVSNLNILPKKIEVTGVIQRFTEGTLSVPVEIVNSPIGLKLNYFPKEVSLSFYVNLVNYDAVDPNDFKVICDYETLKNESQRYLSPKIIQKSALVKSTRLKQNKIEFIILQ